MQIDRQLVLDELKKQGQSDRVHKQLSQGETVHTPRRLTGTTGFSADVACFPVTGNRARIGIVVKESTDPAYPHGVGK